MSKNYGNDLQIAEIVKYISDTMKFPVMGAGGGFAPIGKEGYIDGTLAPQGWLICDGSTHNIADYPDLAAYYASHHGASNYYGGDGITTFAVPVRNGMPTSSVDSPDEHIVGEHRATVDGVLKKKPVYEKKIQITLISAGIAYDTTSLNIDKVINIEGMIIQDTSNILPMNVAYNTNYYSTIAYNIDSHGLYVQCGGYIGKPADVVFKYTKTTDSWQTVQEGHSADGNGIFCVKATVAGDPNAHQYSTEEQVVGMDENGNELYELTIKGTLPNTSGQYDLNIGNNISNCRIIGGYYTDSAGFNTPLGYSINAYNFESTVKGDGTKIYYNIGANVINRPYRLVLEYTKTQ
jgi:microcystin-dependent protein